MPGGELNVDDQERRHECDRSDAEHRATDAPRAPAERFALGPRERAGVEPLGCGSGGCIDAG